MKKFLVYGFHFSVVVEDRSVSQMAWRKAKCSLRRRIERTLLVLFILVSRDYQTLGQSDPMIRSFKGMKPTIPASCYVDESAQIIGDVVLGEHASVWMNAVLRGDVYAIRVGAHSNIQDCSVLHGMKNIYGVTVGEYVTVGHSVTLHGCVIEDRCLIGMGSIILNGAKIGAGSIVAAGTLIPEQTVVEPGSLWMGSPGKFRRKLEKAEDEMIMRYAQNYLGYTEEYLPKR
jgi:carbonic anhydrase/acetyltransferase-like protein (isoleucine patch superfamily)